MKCETCRFWDPGAVANNPDRSPADGICRVIPPKVSTHGSFKTKANHAYWPMTSYNDWCGEWRQKHEAQ